MTAPRTSPAGRRALQAVVLMASVLGLLVGVSTSAMAAPTDVVADPVLGLVGEPLEVSGSGCTGTVTVTMSTWEAGAALELQDATVEPAPDGSWVASLVTPDRPAAVQASCDAEVSVPVAVGAVDGELTGGFGPSQVTESEVVIAPGGPLLEGSTFSVHTEAGELIAETVAVGGTAEIRLPRTLGPTNLLVVGIRVDGSVVRPVVDVVVLGLPNDATLEASPRVGGTGAQVTVFGEHCPGEVVLTVRGHSTDWYDEPTYYPGATLLGAPDGRWSTTMPMPPEVTIVSMTCLVADVRQGSYLVLGVVDGDFAIPTVTMTPDGAVITLPSISPEVEAFTPTGTPIALTPVPGGTSTYTVSGRPGPLLLLGTVIFGENAQSIVDDSPEQWAVDISDPAPPTPPPTGGDAGGTGRPAGGGVLADGGPPPLVCPAATLSALLVASGVALVRRARPVVTG